MRKLSALGVLVVAGLGLCAPSKASTVYTSVALNVTELNLTITPAGSGTNLWDTLLQATNTGTQTLNNVYEFTDGAEIDGVGTTLTGVGVYHQTSGTETATASNAAVFITASELSGYTFSAGGSGSPTTPEIPGFLIAASLGPGQSVDFNEDFILPTSADVFTYFIANGTAPAVPEPGSLALLSSGLFLGGFARRRLKRK